jgi:ABC-type branched-subunit amino acid transport system ATPase component
MNDNVLRALMQLFATAGTLRAISGDAQKFMQSFLRQQLPEDKVASYLAVFDQYVLEVKSKSATEAAIRSLSEGVNRELQARQKFIVYLRLCEFLLLDVAEVTPEASSFLQLVAAQFRINSEEYGLMQRICATSPDFQSLSTTSSLLVHGHGEARKGFSKSLELHDFSGQLSVINLQRAGIMVAHYRGDDVLLLNGQAIRTDVLNVLSQGSVLRNSRSAAIYYSDLLNRFLEDGRMARVDFETVETTYQFRNGKTGLHNFSLRCSTGELVAIMGGSGAGKSTLLSLLNGTNKPTTGKILINGDDVALNPDVARGLIGDIPQDDLLIEELSVFDNLLYNTRLCFGALDEWQIKGKVNEMLKAIGLWEIRDLKVGGVLNKSISGGQRKRLNIALELIREPMILFVDEPTSGLSSRDAENVMDLLKQLALSGKLVFVVIHQPSSDIFKMFDRLVLLDTGGHLIYDGRPSDAIGYFRLQAGMMETGDGLCKSCGTINSEQIFNLVEQEVIDEFGNRKQERKITPKEWYEKWKKREQALTRDKTRSKISIPAQPKIANFKKQLSVFFKRDFFSKLANRQYLLINLLEAPLMAGVLAALLRFSVPGKEYTLYANENIPAYLFICVVVSLFLGLSVSGEEILRDRKIRKRESFLHLSRTAYLWSKIGLLFVLSAIQMASFVLVGNLILGIHGMFFSYFIVLFSGACFSNILGLNISSVMKSSVAVYILIPVLIIPQILLSGVIVKFNKLNSISASSDEIPLAGNLMASRWTYEALAIHQFKDNDYRDLFYAYDKQMSQSTYVKDYWVREMQKASAKCRRSLKGGESVEDVKQSWALLRQELSSGEVVRQFNASMDMPDDQFTSATLDTVDRLLEKIRTTAVDVYNATSDKKEQQMQRLAGSDAQAAKLKETMMSSENQALTDLVLNQNERAKIYSYNNQLVKQFEPVFSSPDPQASFFQHPFFIGEKIIFGKPINTFTANVIVIWCMTILLYFILQWDVLNKLIQRKK